MTLDTSSCVTRYEGHGVTFEYPDIWELTEETAGTDVVLTVTAEAVCFWALRILPDRPRAEEVIDACVDAVRDEYDDAEVAESKVVLAGMPAICREVGFSCFELLNSVSFSSVQAKQMTLLIWWQGTDHELTELRPVFERMTQSVRIQFTAAH